MISTLPDIPDNAVFTTLQLAELLQCHRNSILLWQQKGVLRPQFHRRGRKVFSGKDVKKFFQSVM